MKWRMTREGFIFGCYVFLSGITNDDGENEILLLRKFLWEVIKIIGTIEQKNYFMWKFKIT